MQFPESWLREYCNPTLTTQELADTLTMAGLEVEELDPVAPPFTGIVVGEIKEAVQHPDADRLRICQVDVGGPELLNIVCGAPNARVGIRIPCATVGAELPPGEDGKPFKIKIGKLRGVQSFGMLCSAKELGIDDDASGLLEFPADAPLGQNVREYLNLDDTLFTLKLTPNLAHCLSVYGVARELSALTGTPLKALSFPAAAVALQDKLPVKIEATDLCGRFSGRIVRNVNTQVKTPQWMVDRLARCGQRAVSPLVDISNYVMFELGRPSHIFDLDKIHGGLNVRWGKEGETLKLLNGNTIQVDDFLQVGVIADDQGLESLAGIMGGDATAVSDDTKNIYIEAAFWFPKAVAGRSRYFNFSTDAGHRFERGVDPAFTTEHIERITALVLEICGTPDTQVGALDDQQPNMPAPKTVQLRVARAAKVIGMAVTQQQCLDALNGLGLPATVASEGVIAVTAPTFRFDINLEEDLIEEVARMIGYDNLPTTKPLAPIAPKLRAENRRSPYAVRHALAGLGYQETINFSFVEAKWEAELAGNQDPVKLLNPIASQLSVMRSSLIGSLMQVLKFNVDRRAPRVRVFELGRVFFKDASVVDSDTTVKGFFQPMRVAGLAYGAADQLQWGRVDAKVDFYDVKGDVEALLAPLKPVFEPAEHPAMHPGRCARVLLDGQAIGFVGELHPQWRQEWDLAQAPVMFELELDAVLARQVPVFAPVAKHQAVERDIAVVVKEAVTHAQVMQAIAAGVPRGMLRDAVLFDVFRPKKLKAGEEAAPGSLAQDEKSLAVRLTLGRDDASLTDVDIDTAMQAAIAALQTQVQARLRG
ncbi:phenylalanine--tRNA ligase subunit beta [Comamonas aquatica]|uniref:Phenylalanine--tRNA ligase beta subunit n=1 Tax=Comamonas aquatica TaxID=225991 RepID=A0AA42W5C2_9BURK|nr:phenylalanine--tRNA ligase subunit beta [Comamonas aquatica]MDH0495546.1 phenylalanine--tRNA ligase subunit beta [Comamonas aquatica]MDH1428554.1 phenylalanine--tRNA ligase subunit beta [Comamonas aquatica]MDH1606693.1 phenylalanine--tRNA ligase subunit beta [Comamonas aquatica]MDH1618444.1 phenylalanine--tRNA ligase subunit beta [Comamonas aquatica]MDH1675313.1 phenylalanine--tRNA ligase subunit beta [Comamonas aquatica]